MVPRYQSSKVWLATVSGDKPRQGDFVGLLHGFTEGLDGEDRGRGAGVACGSQFNRSKWGLIRVRLAWVGLDKR